MLLERMGYTPFPRHLPRTYLVPPTLPFVVIPKHAKPRMALVAGYADVVSLVRYQDGLLIV